MCLEYAVVDIRKVFGNKKEITCWKVIRRDNKRRRYFPTCNSTSTPYKLGVVNISDRKNKRQNKYDDADSYHYSNSCFIDKSFHRGFHVFFIKEDAVEWSGYMNEYIIPVKCKRKDYVAHNDLGHVLFMSIKFPKKIKKEWLKNEYE